MICDYDSDENSCTKRIEKIECSNYDKLELLKSGHSFIFNIIDKHLTEVNQNENFQCIKIEEGSEKEFFSGRIKLFSNNKPI